MTGRDLARSGLLVTGAYLASRILGWIRLAVIGQEFGLGPELDAFYAAFRIPDLIFQLVAAGAMSIAVIPIVTGLLTGGERERAWRVASNVLDVQLVALGGLAAAAFFAAPVLVPAITTGFDAAGQARTIELTRVMLLSPILLAVGAMATSLLNAERRFAASVLAPISYNLAIIAGALVLGPRFGVDGLAWAVVGGSAVHVAVQLGPLRAIGFRWSAGLSLADAKAREILRLMGPRVVSLGAVQVNFVVATSLASGVADGAVAAWAFAFALFTLPVGAIGTPMGVVSLPALSRHLAAGEDAAFAHVVGRAVRLVLWVMPPIAALLIVLRVPVIDVLLGYGRFDATGVGLTASALLVLPVAIVSETLVTVLVRAFYAGRDSRVPVTAAIVSVVVDTILAIALAGQYGLAGIGLALAIGSWLEAGILLAVLARRVPALGLFGLLRTGLASTASAVVIGWAASGLLTAAGTLAGSDPGKPTLVVVLGVAGLLGGAIHLAAARLLGGTELLAVMGVALHPLGRRLGVQGPGPT